MSCLSINKQLRHTTRAFTKSAAAFRLKLSMVKRSKAIKFLGKIFGRRRGRAQLRHHGRGRNCSRKLLRDRRSFAPVYVVELYNQQPAPVHVELVIPADAEKAMATAHGTATRNTFHISAATTTITSQYASSPYRDGAEEMNDVNLRAELFIRKFREEMKLQTQRSFREYQEMLARGAYY